jgi:hypothetical protein
MSLTEILEAIGHDIDVSYNEGQSYLGDAYIEGTKIWIPGQARTTLYIGSKRYRLFIEEAD